MGICPVGKLVRQTFGVTDSITLAHALSRWAYGLSQSRIENVSESQSCLGICPVGQLVRQTFGVTDSSNQDVGLADSLR